MRPDGELSEVGSGSVFVRMPGTGDYSWGVKSPDCSFETRPLSAGWLTACTHHIVKSSKFRDCKQLEECRTMTPKPQIKPVAFGDMAISTGPEANARRENANRARERSHQAQRDNALRVIERGLKKCATCGEEKKLEDFPLDRSYLSGRRGTCKACVQLKKETR